MHYQKKYQQLCFYGVRQVDNKVDMEKGMCKKY